MPAVCFVNNDLTGFTAAVLKACRVLLVVSVAAGDILDDNVRAAVALMGLRILRAGGATSVGNLSNEGRDVVGL